MIEVVFLFRPIELLKLIAFRKCTNVLDWHTSQVLFIAWQYFYQGCANFPVSFVISEDELLLKSGSDVQFGSNEQSTSKKTLTVVVSFLGCASAPAVGVATSVETTVSPDVRVEYSQNGVSGLMPRSQVIDTRVSWSGKLKPTSTEKASSGPRFVMVAV